MRLLPRRTSSAELPVQRSSSAAARRLAAALALPRVPTFALTQPAASVNLATVTSWPISASSRQAALSIPTVATCRDLIIGAALQMPVYRYRGDRSNRVPSGALLSQPDPDLTWAATLSGTLEDLIYEGRAYWLVLARDGISSERNPDGLPVRARWIPFETVTPQVSQDVGAYSRVMGYRIDGVSGVVAPENVIRFDSPLPGVLYKGADAIAKAVALEDAAARLADVTIPAGTLTNEGAEVSPEEATEIVAAFEEQRRTYGVAFLQNVSYSREQLSAEDLQLIAARANSATEMARLHNVPVAMVSASPSGGASAMLYANLGSTLALLVNGAVAPLLAAIEQTLSLPSVTPLGQAVAFDVAAFLRSDPDALKAYVLDLKKEQVIDNNEARAMLGIGAANGGTNGSA